MREIKENKVYLEDCLYGLEEMKKQGLAVDLIVTDPPYSIASTRAGGKSELSRSIQPMFDGLKKRQLNIRHRSPIFRGYMVGYENPEHLYLVQRDTDPAIHTIFCYGT